MKCNQQNCDSEAAFRFMWPGCDEAGICAVCASKVTGVSQAMGFPVQLIPLTDERQEQEAGGDG